MLTPEQYEHDRGVLTGALHAASARLRAAKRDRDEAEEALDAFLDKYGANGPRVTNPAENAMIALRIISPACDDLDHVDCDGKVCGCHCHPYLAVLAAPVSSAPATESGQA